MCWILILPIPGAIAEPSVDGHPIRIALTPVILDDRQELLSDFRAWLEQRIGHRIEFTRQRSYLQTLEMLLIGEADFIWTTPASYLKHREQLRLVAVPIFRGAPYDQSHIIVSSDSLTVSSLLDLSGGIFVLSDTESVSGYFYPLYVIKSAGLDHHDFFDRTFHVWSSRNIIEAVADGLADGGAVSGYVWETLRREMPALTAKTRVIQTSPRFGFSPIITSNQISDELAGDLASILTEMHLDAEGRRLLERMNLDRFTIMDESIYEGIEDMMSFLASP